MAGTDVGCADEAPLNVVAKLVEVADDLIKAEGQVPADVLKHDEPGPHNGERVTHVGPEVPVVVLPHAPAGGAERLARIAAGDDVHRRDGGPVDAGDVAEIGGVRESLGEDFAGTGVDLRHPGGACVDDCFDAEVEASVACEE